MANNQGGAIIPYQPTYSIQYKYGDRYGGQNFAKPTTAINTGQAGGPLSAQSTLDGEDATQTIVNPTTASSGNGETLDSEASGAPGGAGGADFSQFRNQYTPAQPDYGWQYAHNYGNDPYTDPSLTGLFNTPTTPPPPAVQGFYGSQQDGGDDTASGDPSAMGLETDLTGMTDVTTGLTSGGSYSPSNDLMTDIQGMVDSQGSGVDFGAGSDLGGPTGAGYGGGSPGTDPTSPNANAGIDGPGSGYGVSNEQNNSETSSPSENTDGGSTDMGFSDFGSAGTLIEPIGQMGRKRDAINHIPPNPILQDPLADYFRRS